MSTHLPSYNKVYKRVSGDIRKSKNREFMQQLGMTALGAIPWIMQYRRQGQFRDEDIARQEKQRQEDLARQDRYRQEDYDRSTIPVDMGAPSGPIGPSQTGEPMGGGGIQRMTPQQAYFLQKMRLESVGEAPAAYMDPITGGLSHDATPGMVPVDRKDLVSHWLGNHQAKNGELPRLRAAEYRHAMDSLARKYGPEVPVDAWPNNDDKLAYKSYQEKYSAALAEMDPTSGGDIHLPDTDIDTAIHDATTTADPVPDHPIMGAFRRLIEMQANKTRNFENTANEMLGPEPASAPANANEALLNSILGRRDPVANPYLPTGQGGMPRPSTPGYNPYVPVGGAPPASQPVQGGGWNPMAPPIQPPPNYNPYMPHRLPGR